MKGMMMNGQAAALVVDIEPRDLNLTGRYQEDWPTTYATQTMRSRFSSMRKPCASFEQLYGELRLDPRKSSSATSKHCVVVFIILIYFGRVEIC